jgi:hypothetical protein
MKGGHNKRHGADQDKRYQACLATVSLQQRHHRKCSSKWDGRKYR